MEKKKSAVVRFTEGANNNVVSNVRVGHMGGDGIVFEGESHSNQVSDFSVETTSLDAAIESKKLEINNTSLNESIKNQIIMTMNELKEADDKPSRLEKYKSLMELADTHLTVFGSLYAGITALSTLF